MGPWPDCKRVAVQERISDSNVIQNARQGPGVQYFRFEIVVWGSVRPGFWIVKIRELGFGWRP